MAACTSWISASATGRAASRRSSPPTFDALTAGPEVEIVVLPSWGGDRGNAAVRDPGDAKGKRAATSVPIGTYPTSRYVDASDQTLMLALGDLDRVSGFGTYTTAPWTSYAFLRSRSGLGSFSDAGRVSFTRSVTPELAEQARAEGFAQVVTSAGPIGVVFDCGAPGDYLTLAAYDAGSRGQVGIIVDLRRPPVRDGAIVDP